jgi:4-oxalocrotonate tautomerase
MPHVVVKLWPGKSEQQKQDLADAIAEDVMAILNCGEESVSVGIMEVPPGDWAQKVFKPDIQELESTLYRKPGYTM